MVAIDPRTRQVLALVGSYEAVAGGLDRATRAVASRAPRSNHFCTATRSTRAAFTRHDARPAARPVTASSKRAPSACATAITKSDNAAAERLLAEVGAENVVEWARALGIESELEPTPSLGAGSVRGDAHRNRQRVRDFRERRRLRSTDPRDTNRGTRRQGGRAATGAPSRRVMQADEAYLTTSLLEERGEGRHRQARSGARPAPGRQDRHDQRSEGRLVRRVLAGRGCRDLGRLRRRDPARMGRIRSGHGAARRGSTS